MPHILIVDDDRDVCAMLAILVGQRGYSTECAYSGEAAVQAARDSPPDLVLLDLHLGAVDGLEVLRRLRARAPCLPIVVVTAFGNVQGAVGAMKSGATDFIAKPFDNASLVHTVTTLVSKAGDSSGDEPTLIGSGPAFRKALNLLLDFAVSDISVLLLGETGTGKEMFARRLHAASKRRAGPFVAVDCSTLAENLIESELFGHHKGAFTGATETRIGRLELAQGGTLFLDEIANLPVHFQAKLLRVLQERRIERVGGRAAIELDVRVVSATNVDLKEAMRAGTVRPDLYYRLQGMTVNLPPLREREGDVRLLAHHFLCLYSARYGKKLKGISDKAMAQLEAYSWPGNVREFENAMRFAVVLAKDEVLPEHLPPEVRLESRSVSNATVACTATDQKVRLALDLVVGLEGAEIDMKALGAQAAEQAERSLLQALINRGPMSGASMAKLLGVDPKTLRTKLRRYGLEA